MSVHLQPGHRVCFTGKMRKSRQEMHARASRESLRPTDTADDADMLVVGDRDINNGRRTTKRKTAHLRGIPVLSETQFFAELARLGAPPPDPPAQASAAASKPNDLLEAWTSLSTETSTINF